MSDEKRAYLLAYDVCNDKRRAHIAKYLQSYGERIQYSLFYFEIRPARLLQIRKKVENEIDCMEDSVLVVNLGKVEQADDAMEFVGRRSLRDVEIPTVI